MAMELGQPGLKTLYLMQILTERTDEEHALNAAEIADILEHVYQVEVSRQTLYTEIKKLTDFGMDIVMKTDDKRRGYYLASRQFELPELKLLVDAVQSSRFITEKKTKDLIGKLESLCSKEEGKQLSSQVITYNRPKTGNETIYYNVDKLHSAIFHNRRIQYRYVDWTVKKELKYRHGGAFYEVSPLHLVWDDENYYLVAYDEKAGIVKHYRVDKMRDMELLNQPRSEASLKQQTDLASFGKKTFGMFGGVDMQVRLVCANHLAGVVLDRFGSDIWMLPKDADHFSANVTVTVSQQFFGWVTAIGAEMQIAGPEEVREQYKEYLGRILGEYGF